MATGKPPWSQQYQEVAASFHIGTTMSHPPIPDHPSFEAKDFLLKCLKDQPCNSQFSRFRASVKFNSGLMSNDFNKSFNPMCEPSEDRQCKFDESPEPERRGMNFKADHIVDGAGGSCRTSRKDEKDFTFPCGQSVSEDDNDEVTESKIRAFIDEKALELKRMQTPLYEDYYYTLNGSSPPGALKNIHDDNNASYLKLPPNNRSPGRGTGSTPPVPSKAAITTSPRSNSRRESSFGVMDNKNLQDIPLPQLSEWRGLIDSQQQPLNPSASFSERQMKWKEELDQELERKRAFQGM